MPQFDELQIIGDAVLNSGWKPPIAEDRAQLTMMRGTINLDLDKVRAMEPRDTFHRLYLHNALRKLHGAAHRWRPQYQKFGTCVGQGDKFALDIIAALNSILYGETFEGHSAVAGRFTISRVKIEKQPGRWEGSNGYQAAAGNMNIGCLLLRDIGLADDDLDNDENLAMKWTASREGVPQQYRDKAGRIPMYDVVTPDSIMLATKLIQAGSPQLVGTTYIPTGHRNAEGNYLCRRSRGGHEICVNGVR